MDQELQSSGSCIGYRQMHQRLLKDHGIVIDRETVRRIVKGLDPDGVVRHLCGFTDVQR